MEFNEFQEKSKRTWRFDVSQNTQLTNAALGLIGESAEVSEHIKKVVFHGHELDRSKIAEELGDVLYYVATLASVVGVELDAVAQGNVDKLWRRYPHGFRSEDSVGREDETKSVDTVRHQPLVLHVYGQEDSHEPAKIVGNKDALVALWEMLTVIVQKQWAESSTAEFFAADGEGYLLTIELNNDDWQSEKWQKMASPYMRDSEDH